MALGRLNNETRLLSAGLLLVFCVSLITSLFFKEKWLWMDEVLSYLLVSDPSISHLNDAVVSGMDANPPLFANLYWFIGHYISLNPQFLRAVSIVIFTVTVILFYVYTTSLLGTPVSNFVAITALIALTYLNLSLSTQIRTYSLFLLISYVHFIYIHRLISEPTRVNLLIGCFISGLLLVFTHNFGLFYLAATGAFVLFVFLRLKERQYLFVLGTLGLIVLVWLVVWYPSFVIQTDAGKPHSWIPKPTFLSFFETVGELAPNLSSGLERQFPVLAILRFGLVIGLFVYVVSQRLRNGFEAVIKDKAFQFYLLAGFVYFGVIGIALVVTFVHTSVFLSRYLWPSHLLLVYQLLYAGYYMLGNRRLPAFTVRLVPVYGLLIAAFLFYQNRKVSIFPSGVLSYLPQLDKRYPVFVETADYFLPIWIHDKSVRVCYLLDWEAASKEGNMLNATVEHKILKSVREKYGVDNVVTLDRFNRKNFPHFYVVDEDSQFQIEQYLQNGQVKVVNKLPIAIKGHQILECSF
jgi:hypothetical protein